MYKINSDLILFCFLQINLFSLAVDCAGKIFVDITGEDKAGILIKLHYSAKNHWHIFEHAAPHELSVAGAHRELRTAFLMKDGYIGTVLGRDICVDFKGIELGGRLYLDLTQYHKLNDHLLFKKR